jgi:hypothetical protein
MPAGSDDGPHRGNAGTYLQTTPRRAFQEGHNGINPSAAEARNDDPTCSGNRGGGGCGPNDFYKIPSLAIAMFRKQPHTYLQWKK